MEQLWEASQNCSVEPQTPFIGMVQNLRVLVNNRREEASPDNVYAG